MSESPAGPGELHNPSVRHERTDVDTKAIIGFVAALAGGIAVVMFAMWGMFALLWGHEETLKRSSYPLAVEERERTSKVERLSPSPRGTAKELIEAQEAILYS